MKKNNLLMIVILCVMMILSLGVVNSVQAQSDQTMTVSGTGTVLLKPDIAIINVSISTEKESVQEALDENTKSVKQVKSALTEMGIPEEDIKTTSYSLYSSQKYYRDETAGMDEYIFSVFYGFEIKLRDISKLNDVLDACINNGVNSINSVSYDSSLREDTYMQARDLAIDDANANAQQIAQKLGVKVGNIKSFQVRDYPTDYGAMYGMGGGGYGGTAPLESGSLKIVVTVDITYEFSLP